MAACLFTDGMFVKCIFFVFGICEMRTNWVNVFYSIC